MTKFKKLFATILLSFSIFSLFPSVNVVNAATVTDTTITLTSAAAENIAINVPYKYYPQTVTVTQANGSARTDVLRSTCYNRYKTLPWLGYKADKVSLDASNNMTSNGNCADRYTDGGVNTTNGGWMAPEGYGGWALRGSLAGTTVSGKTWGNPAEITAGNQNFSDKLAGYSPVIWASNLLPTDDQATYLFRTYSTNKAYTNYPNEKLLSSGTTYFRNEFSLTQDQVDRLTNLALDTRADEFANVFLNGVLISGQQRSTSCATAATPDCLRKYTDITATDLRNAYKLQAGINVLAFQISDKAAWADLNGGSNSNAVGLWYNAKLNLSPTSAGATLSRTLTVTDSPAGVATLTGGTTVPDKTTVSRSTISYTVRDTSYRFVRWDGSCAGTGVNPDSDVYMDADKTCTAVFQKPTLTCLVSPATGETPLVVKATVRGDGGVTGPYKFVMDVDHNNLIENSKPSPFYYTYSGAGSYLVKVYHAYFPDGVVCTPVNATSGQDHINVSNPAGGSGGEVAPR